MVIWPEKTSWPVSASHDRDSGDLLYVRVYIDGIIVFSDDIEEHKEHLCEVLRRFNLFHLCIQSPKCVFFKKSVPYLGNTVSGMGIRIAGTRVAV